MRNWLNGMIARLHHRPGTIVRWGWQRLWFAIVFFLLSHHQLLGQPIVTLASQFAQSHKLHAGAVSLADEPLFLPEPTPVISSPSLEPTTIDRPTAPAVIAPEDWAEPNDVNVGYERGFFIASEESAPSPFRLKMNFQNQFRYTGFARTEREWTDAAGNTLPVVNRNDFDINRGRLIFSGSAIDPDLNFYTNLDYASLGDDRVTILLAWVNYRFCRAFDLYFGKGKVPGGREWLTTSMHTLSPERSLASTFFRPSITTGVWAKGEPLDRLYYQAAIGNGFNTASAGIDDIDTNFVYSGNLWWEPLQEFGSLYSDLAYHETLAIRTGGSLTASRQGGRQQNSSQPEDSFVRLSDGTDLTELGALAPGVSVTEYSIYLATCDLGLKYRGTNLHAEYFFRWLADIQGSAAIPDSQQNLFDHGFHLQAGAFVLPKKLELFTRTSYITGPFGEGSEFAGGGNYFVRGTENWRCTLDVTQLLNSPAEQIRTGYEAGASGVLVRAQLQTIF